MKKDLAAYAIMQYPKSQDKEFNQVFSNKITETDNLNSNNHDLVFRSKVKFEFRDDGNYRAEIMKFLNYIIDLVNDPKLSGEKEKSLADCFMRDVGKFFSIVEDENKV